MPGAFVLAARAPIVVLRPEDCLIVERTVIGREPAGGNFNSVHRVTMFAWTPQRAEHHERTACANYGRHWAIRLADTQLLDSKKAISSFYTINYDSFVNYNGHQHANRHKRVSKMRYEGIVTLEALYLAYRKAKIDVYFERSQPMALAFLPVRAVAQRKPSEALRAT